MGALYTPGLKILILPDVFLSSPLREPMLEAIFQIPHASKDAEERRVHITPGDDKKARAQSNETECAGTRRLMRHESALCADNAPQEHRENEFREHYPRRVYELRYRFHVLIVARITCVREARNCVFTPNLLFVMTRINSLLPLRPAGCGPASLRILVADVPPKCSCTIRFYCRESGAFPPPIGLSGTSAVGRAHSLSSPEDSACADSPSQEASNWSTAHSVSRSE